MALFYKHYTIENNNNILNNRQCNILKNGIKQRCNQSLNLERADIILIQLFARGSGAYTITFRKPYTHPH